MLYISYGAKKSASTFTYLLTRELCRAAGHPDPVIPGEVRGARGSAVNTVRDWTPEVVASIEAHVPSAEIATLRTHVPATPAAVELVTSGRAKHHVGIRDLRDIAISMMDVILRQAERGLEKNREIKAGDVSSTLEALQNNVDAITSWADIPGGPLVRYENVAFNTRSVLAQIQANLGVFVDEARHDAIIDAALSSKNVKINAARSNRHRTEMSASDQQLILDRFSAFYARFYPDARVDVA